MRNMASGAILLRRFMGIFKRAGIFSMAAYANLPHNLGFGIGIEIFMRAVASGTPFNLGCRRRLVFNRLSLNTRRLDCRHTPLADFISRTRRILSLRRFILSRYRNKIMLMFKFKFLFYLGMVIHAKLRVAHLKQMVIG